MTREEVINFGENFLEINTDPKYHIMYEFVESVLKLLKQDAGEDWHDIYSDEMTLEQSRQAVRDLREKLAECLRKEPCEDAVDRKAVLSMAKSYNTDGWNAYTPLVVDVEDIEDLPSVTPTQKWIPVNEKLPEQSTGVLVWCPERKNIYCACYEDKEWWVFGSPWEVISDKIVAWMPLPKPYKEKESEE